MGYEIAMGLHVADQPMYTKYRAEMRPLLEKAGGRFRYDFEVAQVLKSEARHDINRVFVIRFPDRAAKEKFFSDPAYLAVRSRFFEPAVQGITTLAENPEAP